MSDYLVRQQTLKVPRLPLEGSLDLTYRCNNNCRHCWLVLPSHAPEGKDELAFDELRRIADEARSMGCRSWRISGGEPLLRPDFAEIFDYLTSRTASYCLNTNGTLITPAIAQLLKRKGVKMIALYGATADVYDAVTRHPGGFEELMRGFAYLSEAGAGFTVQLIPMRTNWHQWDGMIELAKSLSPHYRVGAAWLYKSACGSPARNAEIDRQRLDPRTVIELDMPDMSDDLALLAERPNPQPGEEEIASSHKPLLAMTNEDDRLFARCLSGRREFHVDPYGGMTFCSFLKDPAMRYDLRKGTVREAWETFIPSLADKVYGGAEYDQNCGSCDKRKDCRWCPGFGWLEHGRFSAPVEHLCDVAGENKQFKEEWQAHHRRYFRIAGITIQVDSDLPIDERTFHPKFAAFRVNGPGADTVTIHHHFTLPDLKGKDLGREFYRRPPWAVFRQKNGSYIYLGVSPRADDTPLHCVATFTADHTRTRIYNDNVREETWRKGDLLSLTMLPSDQLLIARLLADRRGCYLHSAGAIINGAGILFVGHSEAGKSTMTRLLIDAAAGANGPSPLRVEILCDDRNIVRCLDDGWRVYGTWSHGDVPVVSSNDAPLRGICFIEKANENTLTPLTDRREITRRLLAFVIKPFVTADWWHKTLDLIEQMANDVPCYVIRFDKSGEIVGKLRSLGKQRERMKGGKLK